MNASKTPLILHGGKYWKLTEQIIKPPAEELTNIQEIVKATRGQPFEAPKGPQALSGSPRACETLSLRLRSGSL